MTDFAGWVRTFEAEAERRRLLGEPGWERRARLDRAVVRSLQRFQVGENGDGRNLIGKATAAGDTAYTRAVRLFVAEEREHARLLESLLVAAGARTIESHWSDTVFVRLRRLLGLRLELMILMIAEVIALRYYRALRDGSDDPLTSDVAARILGDEQRHVRFHIDRLRGTLHPAIRPLWWLLLLGTAATVAIDHGRALHRLGVPRTTFVRDVTALFTTVTGEVFPARPQESSVAAER